MALEQTNIFNGLLTSDSQPGFAEDVIGPIWSLFVSIIPIIIVAFVFLIACSSCLRRSSDRDVVPVPYMCLTIDSTWRDLAALVTWFIKSLKHEKRATQRETFLGEITQVCRASPSSNQVVNHVPVLVSASVKTSLDLFFRVQKYPPGSEVIVTAINSQDTILVLLHHGLHVVPLDISRDTLAPDVDALRSLITERTVAIVVSHLYGKLCDLAAVADIAHEHGIHVLEDCSQACIDPARNVNPESDLTFFSFDVVHPFTAYGGAVVKIKDKYLLEKMKELCESYPLQRERSYIFKLLVCVTSGMILNNPWLTSIALCLGKCLRIDLIKEIDLFLTAPPPAGLLRQLRVQPSTSLLFMIHRRLKTVCQADFEEHRKTGDYVSERLPQVAGQIGMKANGRSYWLYPILVDDPDEVITRLNHLGINAARTAAQMTLVATPSSTNASNGDTNFFIGVDSSRSTPSMAPFIMDHIIYLPVHRRVPRQHLDQICLAVEIVLNKLAILKRFQATQTSGVQRQTRDGSSMGPYGLPRKGREQSVRRRVSFNPSATRE